MPDIERKKGTGPQQAYCDVFQALRALDPQLETIDDKSGITQCFWKHVIPQPSIDGHTSYSHICMVEVFPAGIQDIPLDAFLSVIEDANTPKATTTRLCWWDFSEGRQPTMKVDRQAIENYEPLLQQASPSLWKAMELLVV